MKLINSLARVFVIIASLFAFQASSTLYAINLPNYDLKLLIRMSSDIVEGKVVRIEGVRKRPNDLVEFEVVYTNKGSIWRWERLAVNALE